MLTLLGAGGLDECPLIVRWVVGSIPSNGPCFDSRR